MTLYNTEEMAKQGFFQIFSDFLERFCVFALSISIEYYDFLSSLYLKVNYKIGAIIGIFIIYI